MISYVGIVFICFSPLNGSCMIITGPQAFASKGVCDAVVESIVDDYSQSGKVQRIEGFCSPIEPAGEDI